MTIRVFLLDDHELARRGVRDLVSAEPDIDVVGEASTGQEAMQRIPATRPDVAVLDVRLGGDEPAAATAEHGQDVGFAVDALRHLVQSGARPRAAASVVAALTGTRANDLYKALTGREARR